MKSFSKSTRFLIILIAVTVLLSVSAVVYVDQAHYQAKRHAIKNTATGFASQIKQNVDHALSATYALATFVRQNQGNVETFDQVASELLNYYPSATAIQLSQNGIISHTHPLEGNERALGYNLLQDNRRDEAAFRAMKTGQLTMSDPFTLIQGGLAAAGRLPVFLETREQEKQFWGFSNVLIRFPDVLENTKLHNLDEQGLAYRLFSVDPHSGIPMLLAQSDAAISDSPISVPIAVPDGEWQLEVTPVSGWRNGYWLLLDIIAGLSFCLLIVVTVLLVRKLRQDQATLEQAVEQRTAALSTTLKHTELALRTARQSWFEMDLNSGEIWVGDEYPALLDYERDEFQTDLETLKNGVHPDDLAQLTEMLETCARTGETTEIEFRRRTKKGYWLWLHAVSEIVHVAQDDTPTRVIGVVTDISRRKHTEILESARLKVLEQLVQNVPLDTIFKSIIGMIEDTSRGALCSILLLDEEKKHLHMGAAPNLPSFYNEAIEGIAIGDGVGSCGTAAFLKKRVIVEDINTHPYWAPYTELAQQAGLASCWSEPILHGDGEILGTFAIYHPAPSTPNDQDLEIIDFAARLAMLAIDKTRTNSRLNLLSNVFDEAEEGIIVTDSRARIVDVNPKFCEITGYTREEALNKNPNMLGSGKQDASFYNDLWQELKREGSWRGEIWNRRKDGELYIEQLTISDISNTSGEITNYVGIFSDITQLKTQQQALEMMAYHDVLTQLPNRVLLTDRFQQATARCNRTGSLLAVCFLDLDNFKQVNDHYGHNVGDQLLVQVSERILSCIRDEDTASRLGGDEFAILIGDIHSTEDCREALDRIHSAICEPFFIDGHELHITASSGITIYPHDQVDIDTLLRHADQAMYRVKLGGKNNFDMFNAKDDQQLIETHNKRRDIEQAFREQQFLLYYQPKVNMCTGDVWGVEALIRWNHPEKGILPPFSFLPAISGTNLEIEIGNWVVKEALLQLSHWHKAGLKLEVSINVSAFHLLSPGFESELTVSLAEYPHIDTQYIQLEILESTDFGNLQAINTIIESCQNNLGVSFALDDFGTGFSSLAHLRNLTADNIKIDCSFVTHLMSSPDDFRIVDGVIRLAEAFDRNVIAEGVESVWEGLMLLLMGCENAQGYAIARPMPAEKLPTWLKGFEPFDAWQAFKGRNLSQRQTMIELFQLSLDYWTTEFEQALRSDPSLEPTWPIADQQLSHCFAWSERCRKEHLISENMLRDIDERRDHVHLLAHEIENHYRCGDVAQARSRLPELEYLVDDVRQQLNTL